MQCCFLLPCLLEILLVPLSNNSCDPPDHLDYKAISLQSLLGKVLTAIFNSGLTNYLSSQNIYGQPIRCSLPILKCGWLNAVAERESHKLNEDGVTFDISNVFERVSNAGLLQKLKGNRCFRSDV